MSSLLIKVMSASSSAKRWCCTQPSEAILSLLIVVV